MISAPSAAAKYAMANELLVPPKWMDNVAAFVVIAVTSAEVFTTVAPYFGMAPNTSDSTLTAQQASIMQNVFIAIVAFLTGSSVATRKKDDTIALQAQTAALAAAPAPLPGASAPTSEATP